MDNQMSVKQSLSHGQYGRQLLEALHTLVRNMRELPNEYRDSNAIFFDWQQLMHAGARAHEPVLMYLMAEYCRLTPLYDIVLVNEPVAFDPGPENAEKLYLDAAEKGCDLARLWLAYCYEEGRGGLRKEPGLSEGLLSKVIGPVDCLFPQELSFLYDELEKLYDIAEEALFLWEDYTDPDFTSLNDRSILLYSEMVLLGLRDVPLHGSKRAMDCYNPEYDWDSSYDEVNERSSMEKADWEAWCRQKGFLAC